MFFFVFVFLVENHASLTPPLLVENCLPMENFQNVQKIALNGAQQFLVQFFVNALNWIYILLALLFSGS